MLFGTRFASLAPAELRSVEAMISTQHDLKVALLHESIDGKRILLGSRQNHGNRPPTISLAFIAKPPVCSFPLRMNPTPPSYLAGQPSQMRVPSEILNNPPQVLLVADDSVVTLLLPPAFLAKVTLAISFVEPSFCGICDFAGITKDVNARIVKRLPSHFL